MIDVMLEKGEIGKFLFSCSAFLYAKVLLRYFLWVTEEIGGFHLVFSRESGFQRELFRQTKPNQNGIFSKLDFLTSFSQTHHLFNSNTRENGLGEMHFCFK